MGRRIGESKYGEGELQLNGIGVNVLANYDSVHSGNCYHLDMLLLVGSETRGDNIYKERSILYTTLL